MKKNVLLMSLACGLLFLNACKKDQDADPAEPADKKLFTLVKNGDSEIGELTVSYYPWGKIAEKSTLVCVDGDGEILKSKSEEVACTNFKKWNINGTIYYTYQRYNSSYYRIPNTGYVNGDVVVTDADLKEINTFQLLPYNGRTAQDAKSSGGHDFILLGPDHYIMQAYYEKEVSNVPASLEPYSGIKVVDNIIQEVNAGSVVWEWSSSDDSTNYGLHYILSDFKDDTKIVDYAHLNSMYIDPADGNLICSFRSWNQVRKINRTTGETMWKLGGTNSDFTLTSNQEFIHQHHATILDDGTLLLFDNGDISLRPQSRVLEFKLDEANKTVTSFSAMDLPKSTFGQYMGSAQKVNGHYIVGCGSTGKIFEFDATTGDVIREFTSEQVSYRALNSN